MKTELLQDKGKMKILLSLRDKIPSSSKELFRFKIKWAALREV